MLWFDFAHHDSHPERSRRMKQLICLAIFVNIYSSKMTFETGSTNKLFTCRSIGRLWSDSPFLNNSNIILVVRAPSPAQAIQAINSQQDL